MWHRLLGDARFQAALFEIDGELASQARSAGCAECRGPLHVADYPRKPRGSPAGGEEAFAKRHSFCCGGKDCRRRMTPTSVRFLDGRVYTGVALVLACVLAHGLSGARLRKLREELELDRRTLERWRRWWWEQVPGTDFWTGLRGRMDSPVEERSLPASLLSRMQGEDEADRLLAFLRLIEPLSHSRLMRSRWARVA